MAISPRHLTLMQLIAHGAAVARVVAGVELAQAQDHTVVLRHGHHLAGHVLGDQRLPSSDDVEPVDGIVVLAHDVAALGRADMVVEGEQGQSMKSAPARWRRSSTSRILWS